MSEGDDCEERNLGAAIDCAISNWAVARWYLEAGTKNRESEGKINGRGGGQKIAPASPRFLGWILVLLESPNEQNLRGCNKWLISFLVPKLGLFLSI